MSAYFNTFLSRQSINEVTFIVLYKLFISISVLFDLFAIHR